MLSLGRLSDEKQRKPTYSVKEILNNTELLKAFKEDCKQGLGILTIILLPDRYPSGAVIFEFPGYRVKRTLRGDEIISWLKSEGFDRWGKDRVQYRLRLTEQGELLVYELPVSVGGYIKTTYGFKYKERAEEKEEGIW